MVSEIGGRAPSAAIRGRIENLDMLRGIAALLVFLGHLRTFTFVNFLSLSGASSATKAFYFATSLGHESVIVFFALSGYLVGGQALETMLSKRWRWDVYLLRRLTRLWVVLIPALCATAIFDFVGMRLNPAGYAGAYHSLYLFDRLSSNGSVVTFLGNAVFLQTICVPIFGSNGPMWSLANELWYYIIFPLLASAIVLKIRVHQRLALFTLFGLLIASLPAQLILPGSIWVAGAAASKFANLSRFSSVFRRTDCRFLLLALPLAAVLLGKMHNDSRSDYFLGYAVAAALPVMAHLRAPPAIVAAVGRGLASMSYSLYLTHFPLLALVFYGFIAPYRWAPGLFGAGVYLATGMVAFLWSALMWWCFERNTNRIFHRVELLLVRTRGLPQSDLPAELAQKPNHFNMDADHLP